MNKVDAKGLLPCPFCGAQLQRQETSSGHWYEHMGEPEDCYAVGSIIFEETVAAWNRRALPASGGEAAEVRAHALAQLRWHDERTQRVHDIVEELREIVLAMPDAERPDGLMKKAQDAVYGMRGRVRLLDDAAITAALSPVQGGEVEPVAYLDHQGLPRLPATFPKTWREEPTKHGITPLYPQTVASLATELLALRKRVEELEPKPAFTTGHCAGRAALRAMLAKVNKP